ncbi:MAG: RimK family alpha-L-glutamate ligase [Bradymonadia bacterium]
MLVHILYENPDWLPPLEAGLKAHNLDYRLVEVWQGDLPIDQPPPEGIWINRMSPSSHTRGHSESVALMRETLAWLEAHDRRVINGSAAFRLEISKVQQDLALRRHGIQTPRTVAGVGAEALIKLAGTFDGPFITKHNQGGKGLGISLFNNADEFSAYVKSDEFDRGPDGVVVLQQYIKPAGGFITRVELVGDRFLYAMRSSTSDGFELCPSDACQIPKQPVADVCPIDGAAKFSLSPITADDPLVAQYIALCKAEGLEVAGIEFVEDAEGNRYTYDINGTTNYNSAVGREAGIDGMHELAGYIAGLS